MDHQIATKAEDGGLHMLYVSLSCKNGLWVYYDFPKEPCICGTVAELAELEPTLPGTSILITYIYICHYLITDGVLILTLPTLPLCHMLNTVVTNRLLHLLID